MSDDGYDAIYPTSDQEALADELAAERLDDDDQENQ